MNETTLNELRDVDLPDAPSLWPPSLGLLLAFFSILVFALIISLRFRWSKKQRIRKELRVEIERLEQQFAAHGDVGLLQSELAILSARIMKHSQGISGKSLSESPHEFAAVYPHGDQFFALLTDDRYTRTPRIDGNQLLKLAKVQVRKCRL